MKRVLTMMLVAAAFALACSATVGTAHAASSSSAPRVTIVIATGLSWADITPTATPTLWRLAETGAAGNVNARLRKREEGESASPSALEGALDISAGNWATPDFDAGAAYNATESVGVISAGEMFRRLTGQSVASSTIGFTGMPMTLAANTDPEAVVVVGTLGQAVRNAGGLTGAIGNSDVPEPVDSPRRQRPAAVAAVDERGLVDAGDVSAGLLRDSADAPYGVETDLAAFGAALQAFEASASAHGGPVLLVLDPGDAYRARRNASRVSSSVAEVQHAAAVAQLDRVVDLAQRRTGPADTLIVASQAPVAEIGEPQGFSPILASGPGLSGYLSSASTHRVGTVTNPDITAAALGALGIERPLQVTGSSFTSGVAPAGARERIDHLAALSTTAIAIDGLRGQVANAFIQCFVAMLVVGGVVVVFRDRFAPGYAACWRRRQRPSPSSC